MSQKHNDGRPLDTQASGSASEADSGDVGLASTPLTDRTIDTGVDALEDRKTAVLAEESLVVSRVERVSGRVRVQSVTDTVEETVRETLAGEKVHVERVPIDRIVTAVPETRTEAGVTIVPVVEEVLVIEKRLLLKEELHIRREATREDVEIPVSLRKQRAVVERLPIEDNDLTTKE